MLELFYYYYAYTLCNKQSNNKKKFSLAERRRRDNRTPRISLKRYSESPFTFLFKSGNDQALLNCCAVDHRVFQNLSQLVVNLCIIDTQWTKIQVQFNRLSWQNTGSPKGGGESLMQLVVLPLYFTGFECKDPLPKQPLWHLVLQQCLCTSG